MIIKPIIPIWLMLIICAGLIALIISNKHSKKKIEKYLIVVLLFVINLRFMLPNGESMAVNYDLNVLFVIDTSISMRALDYNGQKERLEGVVADCCYIVDELSGAKFSIITFGDNAKKMIPFTSDADMVQAELKAIKLEDDFYAQGTSLNLVKDTLEKTLKEETERKGSDTKFIIFFVSDGEITAEGESLESFGTMGQYISNGAVLGYGTTSGGKMVSNAFKDDPTSEYYYLYYYNENFQKTTALSKIDETNLKQLASDFGVDYIQMSKTSNVNYKLNDIKRQVSNSQITEEKITSYQDTYY